MTKYNVYESITLSGCDPINTWVASFLNPQEANTYLSHLNHTKSYRKPNICKSYHIHSETN